MLRASSSRQLSAVSRCSRRKPTKQLVVSSRRYIRHAHDTALSSGECTTESPLLTGNRLFFSNGGPQRHQNPPPLTNGRKEEERVSDREWDLRTGRAIDILQDTLPHFFESGLVATAFHLPSPLGNMHGILEGNGRGRDPAQSKGEEGLGIYSRHIRLEYTPPAALPAPLPQTLTLDGLPLYVASSAFVRHTLLALYTDLQVVSRKVTVHTPSSSNSATQSESESSSTLRRDKSVTISLLVSGLGRLGLGGSREAEWDVTATYIFSPLSGLIVKHVVNSIHPAPHETVYSSLRASLMKLGLGGQESLNVPGKLGGVANAQSLPECVLEDGELRR